MPALCCRSMRLNSTFDVREGGCSTLPSITPRLHTPSLSKHKRRQLRSSRAQRANANHSRETHVLQATNGQSSGTGGASQGAARAFNLRQGTEQDLATIQNVILKEMMNPLSLQPRRFVVATDSDSGAVLGFGQLVPVQQGASAASTASGGGSSTTYEIRSVVVLPKHRGRGIGSAIVHKLLQQAGGNACVYLTTVEGPNVQFYQRLGLEEVPSGRVPAFLVPEQLAGNLVTQLFFRKRCLVLGRVLQ